MARFDTTLGLKEQDYTAVVETFPLVPPNIYQVHAQQVPPDAVVTETFSDKPYLHGELVGRMVSHGYGDASRVQDDHATDIPLDGAYFTLRDEGGNTYRKRTVMASSPYHSDTDYSVELRHSGRQLLDVHGVSLRFHEEQGQEDIGQ